MKKRSVLCILMLAMLLPACNKPPKTFVSADEYLQLGKYEKAIEVFRKVNDEDGPWLDSAQSRILVAFDRLLQTNDWERINDFLELQEDEKKFRRDARNAVIRYTKANIREGRLDTVIAIFSVWEPKLRNNLDTVCTSKIADLIMPEIFSGEWTARDKNLNGKQIAFRRNGDIYEAVSLKSGSGWDKDKVMYRINKYLGGMLWRCESRIFSNSYYLSSEYFAKKGRVEVFSRDSIYIDYGASGLDVTFVRNK